MILLEINSITGNIFAFAAAMLAGTLNAVAGGGTFFAFPALLILGVPPIAANATCSVAVWPGSLASLFAYRKQLEESIRHAKWMVPIGLAGGGIGALILLNIPEKRFEAIIPWLLLGATLLFAGGKNFQNYLKKIAKHKTNPTKENTEEKKDNKLIVGFAQFLIAIYGGFFGAGIGILTLAALQWMNLRDIHQMNALKTFFTSAINATAVFIFIASGIVVWKIGIIMIGGALLGGYFGAKFSLVLNPNIIRKFVIVVGFSLTIWFFYVNYNQLSIL